MTKRKAVAYVDGFNFYYGAVKARPQYKWLDFPRMCDALVPECDVSAVRYYTARVTNRPNDPGQSQRQDVYLRALRTLPRMEIIEGQFQQRAKMVFLADRTGFVKALVSEEKGSDVNLGTDLVWDALKEPDLAVALVLSNDFDLQRPVRRAVSVGIEVLVVNPHRSGGQRPKVKGSGTRNLREWHLRDHQLPETVYDRDGRAIRRPVEW